MPFGWVKSWLHIPAFSLCIGLSLVHILWGNFDPLRKRSVCPLKVMPLWIDRIAHMDSRPVSVSACLSSRYINLNNLKYPKMSSHQFIATLSKTKRIFQNNISVSIISRKKSINDWIITLNKHLLPIPLPECMLSFKMLAMKNAKREWSLMRFVSTTKSGMSIMKAGL